MEPSSVHVDLKDRSYTIEIGSGNLDNDLQSFAKRFAAPRAFVVTDANVGPLYVENVSDVLRREGIEVSIAVVPAGENSKCLTQLNTLWEQLLSFRADRKTTLVALGGGVVGDLGGFAAASYMRGIDFVQIPTSLLAQVDSSVGGKVGINLPAAKNMVGAFWQPRSVIIDTEVLSTLPKRELSAGLAEIIKYGVILDPKFFEYLENHVDQIIELDQSVLRQIVKRSCELKALVVAEDETEQTGRRAILNYGHTFAHAFESLCGYGTILHGEAVAIGMDCAARLAEKLGMVDADFVQRQKSLIERFGLPTDIPTLNPDEIINSMKSDKKADQGELRFILPNAMGDVGLLGDVSTETVDDVLRNR